jgi:hypothetical protein
MERLAKRRKGVRLFLLAFRELRVRFSVLQGATRLKRGPAYKVTKA